MHPYFTRTPQDDAFYHAHLLPRLPATIFDVHVHVNLPAHIAMVPEARRRADWALECGSLLPCEDAHVCARHRLTEDDIRVILGDNARRLLGVTPRRVAAGGSASGPKGRCI